MKLRLKDNVKKVIHVLIIVILILLCFWFLSSRATYTAYESEVNADIQSPVAGWKISIDGQDISTTNSSTGITIKDVTWSSSGTAENKLAPGSTGTMNLVIDPSGTDVAIYYEVEIIDRNVDESKFLKVNNVTISNTSLTKIDVSKYAGILSLAEIKSGLKPTITLDIVWDSEEDIVYDEEAASDLDSFIVVNFFAKQYSGEEILTTYTE